MRIHTYGDERAPMVIMLPGSFCNADTMANIITELQAQFRILAVDYNEQYAGSGKPFTSRCGEAGRSSAICGSTPYPALPLYTASPWAGKSGWS